jgi:hypothetical protein
MAAGSRSIFKQWTKKSFSFQFRSCNQRYLVRMPLNASHLTMTIRHLPDNGRWISFREGSERARPFHGNHARITGLLNFPFFSVAPFFCRKKGQRRWNVMGNILVPFNYRSCCCWSSLKSVEVNLRTCNNSNRPLSYLMWPMAHTHPANELSHIHLTSPIQQ